MSEWHEITGRFKVSENWHAHETWAALRAFSRALPEAEIEFSIIAPMGFTATSDENIGIPWNDDFIAQGIMKNGVVVVDTKTDQTKADAEHSIKVFGAEEAK